MLGLTGVEASRGGAARHPRVGALHRGEMGEVGFAGGRGVRHGGRDVMEAGAAGGRRVGGEAADGRARGVVAAAF